VVWLKARTAAVWKVGYATLEVSGARDERARLEAVEATKRLGEAIMEKGVDIRVEGCALE